MKSVWEASKTDAPGVCMDSEQCMSNWSEMVLEQSYFSKAKNGGILGIAKDGHLLVGPWNDEGEQW